jgi:hypothetical protein
MYFTQKFTTFRLNLLSSLPGLKMKTAGSSEMSVNFYPHVLEEWKPHLQGCKNLKPFIPLRLRDVASYPSNKKRIVSALGIRNKAL